LALKTNFWPEAWTPMKGFSQNPLPPFSPLSLFLHLVQYPMNPYSTKHKIKTSCVVIKHPKIDTLACPFTPQTLFGGVGHKIVSGWPPIFSFHSANCETSTCAPYTPPTQRGRAWAPVRSFPWSCPTCIYPPTIIIPLSFNIFSPCSTSLWIVLVDSTPDASSSTASPEAGFLHHRVDRFVPLDEVLGSTVALVNCFNDDEFRAHASCLICCITNLVGSGGDEGACWMWKWRRRQRAGRGGGHQCIVWKW
jgi:hypothetical protein